MYLSKVISKSVVERNVARPVSIHRYRYLKCWMRSPYVIEQLYSNERGCYIQIFFPFYFKKFWIIDATSAFLVLPAAYTKIKQSRTKCDKGSACIFYVLTPGMKVFMTSANTFRWSSLKTMLSSEANFKSCSADCSVSSIYKDVRERGADRRGKFLQGCSTHCWKSVFYLL